MNTIQLIGRLTQDPELRFTNGGMATTKLRLAVPRRKKDGEEQAPVYVDVVTFGKQAEAVAEHLAKGRRVGITGRLEYREWNVAITSTECLLETVRSSIVRPMSPVHTCLLYTSPSPRD